MSKPTHTEDAYGDLIPAEQFTVECQFEDGECVCGRRQGAPDDAAPSLVLSEVNTGSYVFAVVGLTAKDNEAALLAAWNRHADQTEADPDFMAAIIAGGDVNHSPTGVGVVLRDGSPV